MKVITFLTDFGTRNSYAAQMKGVASTLTDARLIDITHDITPHSIQEGAFALLTSVDIILWGRFMWQLSIQVSERIEKEY